MPRYKFCNAYKRGPKSREGKKGEEKKRKKKEKKREKIIGHQGSK